jgi:hypothetical protein
MKLFLVHCGYYDSEICDGLYESHSNFFVVAESFEDARKTAKLLPEFQQKRMHIDGLQEIQAVQGYSITLHQSPELQGESIVISNKHRELAPKK